MYGSPLAQHTLLPKPGHDRAYFLQRVLQNAVPDWKGMLPDTSLLAARCTALKKDDSDSNPSADRTESIGQSFHGIVFSTEWVVKKQRDF